MRPIPADQPADPNFRQTLRTVWITMIVFNLAILAALLVLPLADATGDGEDLGEIFPILLGLVSVGEAIAVIVLFRARVLQPLQSGAIDLGRARGVEQVFQGLILCWALADSVALYGLLVGLLGYQQILGVPFVASSLILLYLTRPSQPALQPPASLLGRTGQPLG